MSLHDSEACRTTAVPESSSSSDYRPQGQYVTISSTKCYVTGPATATKAILFVYDIFGFTAPTLQGADIYGKAGYRVIMPDLFDDEPVPVEWVTSQTEENKQKMGTWRATKLADRTVHARRCGDVMKEAKKEGGVASNASRWAGVGYCWGGKLVSTTSGAGPMWDVGVQSSPAAVSAEDAGKVTIPMMMLASQGEAADDVQAYEKALTVPHVVERFGERVHGWMSARADLNDSQAKADYEKGYGLVIDFLGKHL